MNEKKSDTTHIGQFKFSVVTYQPYHCSLHKMHHLSDTFLLREGIMMCQSSDKLDNGKNTCSQT